MDTVTQVMLSPKTLLNSAIMMEMVAVTIHLELTQMSSLTIQPNVQILTQTGMVTISAETTRIISHQILANGMIPMATDTAIIH